MKTPSARIFLRPEVAQSAEKAKLVHNDLENATVNKFVTEIGVYFDPHDDGTTTRVKGDEVMVDMFYELCTDAERQELKNSLSPWLLRLVMNQTMMNDSGVSMEQLEKAICTQINGGIHCIHSEDNAAEWVLRLRLVDPNRAPDTDMFKMESEWMREHEFLQGLYKTVIGEVLIKGIKNITCVYMREEKVKRGTEKCTEWILETDGTALLDIMGHPDVDYTQTVSNSIEEIALVLGIEAARAALSNELLAALEFSYINAHHMSMVIDVMTCTGELLAMDRYGMARNSYQSPVARASFETSTQILSQAGVSAEYDPMLGPSEAVLSGKLANLGTGAQIELFADEEMLKNAVDTQPITADGWRSGIPLVSNGAQTPKMEGTPEFSPEPMFSPYDDDLQFSPAQFSPDHYSPRDLTDTAPAGWTPSASPPYVPRIPQYWGVMSDHVYEREQPPAYSPSRAGYDPPSPAYSPSSPAYSPSSPAYDPDWGDAPPSPAYDPDWGNAPAYSPSSPAYFPVDMAYSPMAPATAYSPTNATYDPNSALSAYSPKNAPYSPTD